MGEPKMIKIIIPPEDQKKLATLRYRHPSRIVRRRFAILHFKCLNRSHGEIAKLAGASYTMVATVLKLYVEKGLEGVEKFDHFVPVSNLEMHREVILKQFQENPPATAKEAAASIQKLTGIKKGVTQTKKFLHKLGFKPRKTAAVPAKANVEAQAEFKKKFWSQDSRKQKKGKDGYSS
jgi:transposase